MRERVDLDIAAIDVITTARIAERGFPTSAAPYSLAITLDCGHVHVMNCETLWRARAIIADLKPERVDVLCGRDEDYDGLLSLVTGRTALQ